MKVVKIHLVLENCESLVFKYPEEVFCLQTSDIKEHYVSYSNGIQKQKHIDGFTIVFNSHSGELGTFSPDNNVLPLERLNKYKDVTAIVVEFEDGTKDYLGVSWEGVESETIPSGQHLILTDEGAAIYYSEAGSYKCTVSADEADCWKFMSN
jgi:hypothetical protein